MLLVLALLLYLTFKSYCFGRKTEDQGVEQDSEKLANLKKMPVDDLPLKAQVAEFLSDGDNALSTTHTSFRG